MARVCLPNHPDNYIVPSAISIWFAPLRDDGTLCDWFDLGCARDIALTFNDTFLTHSCARNGLMSEDKHVVTTVAADIKFTLDEMVGQNLLLAFRPNVVPQDDAVYEVLDQKRFRLIGTDAQIIDPLAVEVDATDYLDLYWSDAGIDDVLVRSCDGVTTYVEGVDYVFTQAAGTGSGRTPATIARDPSGSIPEGAEIWVSYKYVRETTSYAIQTGAVLEGALKIQALSRIGPAFAYYFPFVSFGIEGDMTINPAEWFSQSFNVKLLTDGTGSRGSFHLFDIFQKLASVNC